MTEKEFLITFIEHAEAMGKLGDNNILDAFIDNYLEYHHQTYYEVEFVKKLKPLEMVDDRNILSMDDGEGEKTIHEMYDGRTVSFTKCWEDNEGFQHHIDGCSYECGIGHPR